MNSLEIFKDGNVYTSDFVVEHLHKSSTYIKANIRGLCIYGLIKCTKKPSCLNRAEYKITEAGLNFLNGDRFVIDLNRLKNEQADIDVEDVDVDTESEELSESFVPEEKVERRPSIQDILKMLVESQEDFSIERKDGRLTISVEAA